MKLAITDANIFIDLFYLDLVRDFFELDIELFTTLEVINELDDGQQEILIKSSKLIILTSENQDYLSEFESLSSRLSIADLSIFHHAREINAGIITGDSLLRRLGLEYGFEVHGILWVMERFVSVETLEKETAIRKQEDLMEFNKRLPADA